MCKVVNVIVVSLEKTEERMPMRNEKHFTKQRKSP